MKITQTPIEGLNIIDLDTHRDTRGAFTRMFCAQSFDDLGLPSQLVQWNLSQNPHRGTLRGLHWQDASAPEDKLIHCIAGEIWDVAVDMRAGSATYGHHVGITLSAGSARAFQVPAGCAHGFITRAPDTQVLYGVSGAYTPQAERGARWNDPALAIDWPEAPTVISDKDAAWGDLTL